MDVELYDELLSVVEALDAAGVEYALCGGVALAIHGHPRFTADIDFLVLPDAMRRISEVLAPLGYTLPSGDLPFDVGGSHERHVFRISRADGEDVLSLDFLLCAPFLREVWETREHYSWRGKRVTVVSRDGLIAMKRVAGRPRDRIDLQELEPRADE
jgi:hypothetical protein